MSLDEYVKDLNSVWQRIKYTLGSNDEFKNQLIDGLKELIKQAEGMNIRTITENQRSAIKELKNGILNSYTFSYAINYLNDEEFFRYRVKNLIEKYI